MLHMETFHNQTGIISNCLRWSLSDPEFINIDPAMPVSFVSRPVMCLVEALSILIRGLSMRSMIIEIILKICKYPDPHDAGRKSIPHTDISPLENEPVSIFVRFFK